QSSGRAGLPRVPLAVQNCEGVDRTALSARDRETGRRIHSPREQHHTAARPTPRGAHRAPPTRISTAAANATAESMPRKLVEPFVRIPRFSSVSPSTESTWQATNPAAETVRTNRTAWGTGVRKSRNKPNPASAVVTEASKAKTSPRRETPPFVPGGTARPVRILRAWPDRTPNSLANVSAPPNESALANNNAVVAGGRRGDESPPITATPVGMMMWEMTFETPRSPERPSWRFWRRFSSKR